MSALVDYSSSDEAEADEQFAGQNTQRGLDSPSTSAMPSLPEVFRSLYATNVRTSNADDPDLHGGRRRQVAHVKGKWPSHVYTEWHPSRTESACLQDLINVFQAKSSIVVTSSLEDDLGVSQPLHISLSRSLQLATEEREVVHQGVANAIYSSNIHEFQVRPSGLKWVSNYDETRSFLALALQQPQKNELNQLLQACNQSLAAHGHPPLYTQGEDELADYSNYFHFSLAWSVQTGVVNKDVDPALEEAWSCSAAADCHQMNVLVNSVLLKIGNTIHTIELRSKTKAISR